MYNKEPRGAFEHTFCGSSPKVYGPWDQGAYFVLYHNSVGIWVISAFLCTYSFQGLPVSFCCNSGRWQSDGNNPVPIGFSIDFEFLKDQALNSKWGTSWTNQAIYRSIHYLFTINILFWLVYIYIPIELANNDPIPLKNTPILWSLPEKKLRFKYQSNVGHTQVPKPSPKSPCLWVI